MTGAKKLDEATTSRLAALARQRTPAAIGAQLAEQEAEFQREAAIRKAQSVANVEKWNATRKSRGQGK
jgi:hypothetical protein